MKLCVHTSDKARDCTVHFRAKARDDTVSGRASDRVVQKVRTKERRETARCLIAPKRETARCRAAPLIEWSENWGQKGLGQHITARRNSSQLGAIVHCSACEFTARRANSRLGARIHGSARVFTFFFQKFSNFGPFVNKIATKILNGLLYVDVHTRKAREAPSDC